MRRGSLCVGAIIELARLALHRGVRDVVFVAKKGQYCVQYNLVVGVGVNRDGASSAHH